ncbi:MAG: MBL fold metallo-hydrolase [Anaerolineales bacterium]|nr:MBL fold metallo-hydrolase [Anaerolineales bacterium]
MFEQYGNLVVGAILIILLAGCSSAATVPPSSTPGSTTIPSPTSFPVPELGSVILQFIGNSCTLSTASDGTRIVSDPYGDYEHPAGIGPLPKDLEADAVTVSHAHEDHNNSKAVGGSPQVITEAGIYQIGKIKVTGYAGFEGSPSGPSQNPHVVFVFEVDGVKIVHMGDSGPITEPDARAAVENADVILFNIDGYVIPAEQIVPFLQQVKARTWIATHYSLREDARWQGAPTIDEFVKNLPSDLPVVRLGSEIVVTPNMPNQAAVLISRALRK